MHFLEEEPTKSNPASQLNFIVLGKVVTVPKDEPLLGGVKAPQSTATGNEGENYQNLRDRHFFHHMCSMNLEIIGHFLNVVICCPSYSSSVFTILVCFRFLIIGY